MIFSWILFILVGGIIGLVGGGGGIFAIPTLIYGFHIDPALATFYSMVVVGMTSVIGVILSRKKVMWKVGMLFAIPSLIITILTRRYFVPALPETIWIFEKSTYLLIFFTFIMFASGCSLVCKKKNIGTLPLYSSEKKKILTTLRGSGVGFITGLVGAGAGFMIVPALIIFERLEPKIAIATSMFIIALNMLIGSAGKIPAEMDERFLISIIFIAVLGLSGGLLAQKYFQGEHLTKGFAYFTIIAAVMMFVKELFF